MTKEKKQPKRSKRFNYLGLTFSLLAFVFAGSILFASIWRASAQNVIKSDKYQLTVDYRETESEQSKVDYFLAYPGILPDHPLYPIKVLRDRIWLFLTLSKTGKAEKQLLFADKRIFAALKLAEKGNPGKAMETALKAEYYLLDAVQTAKQIEDQKADQLRPTIAKAALKHQEILQSLKLSIEGAGEEIDRSLELNNQAQMALK